MEGVRFQAGLGPQGVLGVFGVSGVFVFKTLRDIMYVEHTMQTFFLIMLKSWAPRISWLKPLGSFYFFIDHRLKDVRAKIFQH